MEKDLPEGATSPAPSAAIPSGRLRLGGDEGTRKGGQED